ncbi:hypothetical protein SNE40_004050 [Patella caerulea]|uniref:NAD(P)(+)--arginine ADP-ribosyltransferase n=1 Tax=Patella caerulea TaxID=87958 RepID=A0AAN8QG78_PATCE
MDFRGHFVFLLVAAVTFSNLIEAITVRDLENEASVSKSFTYALKTVDKMFKDLPAACQKYLSVIDEAEMTMIIAYTTGFHDDLNAYVRGDRNRGSFPKAKEALSKALKKLGDHQRENGMSWDKLYRAENSTDVLGSYRNSESTGKEGKLVQFTSTSTQKQVAEKWQIDFEKDYLTTFLSPSSGAYLEDCTTSPGQYEVLLPFDTPYKVAKGDVQKESATLDLDVRLFKKKFCENGCLIELSMILAKCLASWHLQGILWSYT